MEEDQCVAKKKMFKRAKLLAMQRTYPTRGGGGQVVITQGVVKCSHHPGVVKYTHHPGGTHRPPAGAFWPQLFSGSAPRDAISFGSAPRDCAS